MISLQSNNDSGEKDASANNLRYEIKYVTKETELGKILSRVHAHRAGFVEHHPTRQVNSIYFDSANYDCLESGLAGLSERAKIRLRWYGNSLQPKRATLEHKQKYGALGRKISQMFDTCFDFENMSHMELRRFLCRETKGPLAHVIAMYCYPVLLNSYDRLYYISADKKVRLTIDSNLKFYDQRLSARFNTRRARPTNGTLVVEIKAHSEDADLVTEIANHFGFRATAFSKFAVGLLGQTSL
jgi:SPX domain protein involved in polyphosphate accumulation